METKQFQMSGFSVVVTKENENGASFEFWTDESECPAELTPCRMRGTAQLMRSGSFFFVPNKPKQRAHSTLLRKGAHGRISATQDEAYQLTIKVFKREGLDVKETMLREALEMINNVKF